MLCAGKDQGLFPFAVLSELAEENALLVFRHLVGGLSDGFRSRIAAGHFYHFRPVENIFRQPLDFGRVSSGKEKVLTLGW